MRAGAMLAMLSAFCAPMMVGALGDPNRAPPCALPEMGQRIEPGPEVKGRRKGTRRERRARR